MTQFPPLPLLLTLALALAFSPSAFAKPKNSRPALLERIEAACLERLGEDFPEPAKICGCVGRNLDSKLGSQDLELITRSHEEDPKSETELQKEKHGDLLRFDYEVTESCLENPSWNHN